MPDVTTERPDVAPVDGLGREILAVLDLVKPKLEGETRPAYRGYGETAAEAYFHLSQERDPERELPVRKLGKGPEAHWWLLAEDGRVIDPSLNAQERRSAKNGKGYPYEQGKGAMFRTGASKPSKRAAAIIELVRSRV